MSNNEFYKSNEYNKTSEYQHFPAEMYLSNNDINFTGIENPNTGQEITTNNTNTKHNKKTNSSSKSLLNKIFDGIKSIATTAVVAVASIVATASISVAKPDIDLLYFSHGSNYVEYSISAKDINENSDYMLVISTTNEKDIEFEITSDGIYENRVDGLKPEWEYKISVIGKDDFLGTITYFEKKFQTTEINNNTELEQTPTLDIKDVTISGANTLEITYDFDAKTYNSENINNLLFNISYGDNNNQIVEISYDELVLGKKTLNISENISSITINSSFIFTNNQISKEIVSEEKVFELNNNFEVKYSIDTYNQYIKLSPIGIFENETYIVVSTSENTESVPYNLFYDIFIPYENSGEITLNYYLSNESGEILSDEQTITVDTNFERVNYNFSYKNPSDIGITYNPNGSINLYIETSFMCDDLDVYYQIKLTNYESNITLYYTFKEELAIITNLPNTNYGITYDVCKNINGVQYSFMNVTPSGTINETYFDYYISGVIFEKDCQISLNYSTVLFDLSTVKAVGSNNEEIILTETDFTNNTDDYNYTTEITFNEEISSVTFYIKCAKYYSCLESIEESKIIGSLYNEIPFTIYAQ